MTTHDIRALNADECEAVSGGIGWFIAIPILAGAAGFGVLAAIVTKPTKAEAPKIDVPPSPEFPD